MQKVILIAVAALVVSVALAGCGGKEALSKSQLVARGDALCAKAEREADALGEPTTIAEGNRISDVFETTIADLRALQPPDEDRERIDAILTDLDRGWEQVRLAFERTIAAGGSPADLRAPAGWRLIDRAATAASAYGFRVCGHDD